MSKAFTLIELLAVIVILAIIALIAVPIVINIINNAKKESYKRSVDLYVDAVEKTMIKHQMTHSGFNSNTWEIYDSGKNLKCGEEIIEIKIKGQTPEYGTIILKNNKVTYDIVMGENEYILNDKGKEEIQKAPILAAGTDYRGYYADIDWDGIADGIIYADLAQSASGNWYNATMNLGQASGGYSYDAKTNLNEYIVSDKKYTEGKFGENKIIRLKNNKNNPRFYVMALTNFTTNDYAVFYWYKNAYDKMDLTDTDVKFGTGFSNTGKIIERWNKNGIGAGSYVGATQDNQDIWKYIQDKYAEGWYIPSREEWASFADYITNGREDVTKINYIATYGLSPSYLTSSQKSSEEAWGTDFLYCRMYIGDIANSSNVRLGTNF